MGSRLVSSIDRNFYGFHGMLVAGSGVFLVVGNAVGTVYQDKKYLFIPSWLTVFIFNHA